MRVREWQSLRKYILYLVFLLSGSAGLIYEVLWHRKLTLIFGSTVYAAATILTVFFSGLALGAYLIGRFIDKGRNPVVSYVVLEALIGLFGFSSPFIFAGIDQIYLSLVPYAGDGLARLTALRFSLAYMALLLPTTLMGATLPVLVKFVSDSDGSVSFNAGRLYGINTVGAAVGAFLGGIVLIPLLGVDDSIYAAGLANLLIAGVVFGVFRGKYAPLSSAVSCQIRHTVTQRLLLAFFCVAGFISMAYQVAWIRVLSQVSGSSVYAFGLILSIFIAGVGLGSEVATRFLNRVRSVIAALVIVEFAASLYTLFFVNYYDYLPVLYTYVSTTFGLNAFGGSFAVNAVVVSAMLFFPTLMFGAAFPLMAAGYARAASSSGGDVGAVYALNTVGGVAGSFIGGFVFLPYLGSQVTVTLLAIAGMVLSVSLSFMVPEKRYRAVIGCLCGVSVAAVALSYKPWDVRLIDSAPYIFHYGSVADNLKAKDNARLMYYKEGVNVNVSVFGEYEAKTISINGKTMASVALTDKSNQYLLGHLPMLLHPDPKSSLVIGLGAGMTFSALVRHGQPADVVEISPEVVGGAELFAKHNRSVLKQPNARLIFNDGRNYLKTTHKKYDVITEDPLDPFFMGSGYLYNVEHFRNAKRALNPGGIMCQYLPLYQVGVEESRIIIRSFHEVFPYVTAWFSYDDMVLIGSEKPLKINVAELERRISRPEIAQDLKEIGIDNVYDFLSNYLFDQDRIREITEGVPLNTDNYPIIEYLTPLALFRDTTRENILYFSARRVPEFPGSLLLGTDGDNRRFLEELGKYFDARTHLIKSHLFAAYKDYDGMLGEVAEAIRVANGRTFATYYLADAYAKAGVAFLGRDENQKAVAALSKAFHYRMDVPEIMNPYAEALFKTGNPTEAVELYQKSLAMENRQIFARFNLAQVYFFTKQYDKARKMIDYCLEVNADDVDFLIIKAQIELMSNNRALSAKLIERILKRDPHNERALRLKQMV